MSAACISTRHQILDNVGVTLAADVSPFSHDRKLALNVTTEYRMINLYTVSFIFWCAMIFCDLVVDLYVLQ